MVNVKREMACLWHGSSLDRNVTKSRFFALVTFANVLILAGGFYYLQRLYSKAIAPSGESTTNEVAEVRPVQPKPEPAVSNSPPVLIQTNDFNWRQVESADYRAYIANLRAIGCPEATIKDIILTDIMRLFAERRGQFYQNGREFKFWETSEKRALTARQLEEREKQLGKIDKEVPGILRELLGINYERELNKYFVDSREDDRRLGFVPEVKRSQLLALREEVEGLKEHLFDQAQNGHVDLEGLKKIQEHQKEMLAQILSPEERHEYELRTSETAERLRKELVGFNPSEEEFRQIYALWQAHDDKFAFVSADDEAAAKAKEQDRQRIEEQIKANLGPDRSMALERAKNPEYQELSLFAERYELPQSTAQTLFEIKQVAETARQSLLAEKNIAATDRQAALKAIQDETQRAVRQNLGEKLFPAYARNVGTWMDGLAGSESAPR